MQSDTTTIQQEVHEDTTTTNYPGRGKRPAYSILRTAKYSRHEASDWSEVIVWSEPYAHALIQVHEDYSFLAGLGFLSLSEVNEHLHFARLSFDCEVAHDATCFREHYLNLIHRQSDLTFDVELEICDHFNWNWIDFKWYLINKELDEEEEELDRIRAQLYDADGNAIDSDDDELVGISDDTTLF